MQRSIDELPCVSALLWARVCSNTEYSLYITETEYSLLYDVVHALIDYDLRAHLRLHHV